MSSGHSLIRLISYHYPYFFYISFLHSFLPKKTIFVEKKSEIFRVTYFSSYLFDIIPKTLNGLKTFQNCWMLIFANFPMLWHDMYKSDMVYTVFLSISSHWYSWISRHLNFSINFFIISPSCIYIFSFRTMHALGNLVRCK